MTSAHLLAAGPVKLRAQSLHGLRERHVHQVVGCSNQQRNSILRWGRKPASKVQAISEEVVESIAGNGTQNGNGTASKTVPIEQSTLSVHAGESGGRCKVSDSLTTPICCTSTYYFQDTAELIAYQEGRYGSYEYGRYVAVIVSRLHSAALCFHLPDQLHADSVSVHSLCDPWHQASQ